MEGGDDFGPHYSGPQSSPFPEGPPTPLGFSPDQMMHKVGPGGAEVGPKKSTSRRNAWGNLSYADLITQEQNNKFWNIIRIKPFPGGGGLPICISFFVV